MKRAGDDSLVTSLNAPDFKRSRFEAPSKTCAPPLPGFQQGLFSMTSWRDTLLGNILLDLWPDILSYWVATHATGTESVPSSIPLFFLTLLA